MTCTAIDQSPRHVTELDEEIGLALRRARRKASITLEDLSKALGVSYQQAHKYENGTNRISAGRLFKACQVIGVPVASMFPEQDTEEEPVPPAQKIKLHLNAIEKLVEGAVS
ncbi:helix-turn-helix domain-containing protein [Thalassovita mediterranea]|nr:helix-turn-helix domain-containing protein [Thalassovita mediterranea]